MDLMPIVCPKCGANIQAPVAGRMFYCTYCGTRLVFDDGSKTVTYRTVDEARIKEIDLESRRFDYETSTRLSRLKIGAILGVVGMLMLLLGCFAGHASGDGDSPWYMVSVLGFFPLGAAAFVFGDGHNP